MVTAYWEMQPRHPRTLHGRDGTAEATPNTHESIEPAPEAAFIDTVEGNTQTSGQELQAPRPQDTQPVTGKGTGSMHSRQAPCQVTANREAKKEVEGWPFRSQHLGVKVIKCDVGKTAPVVSGWHWVSRLLLIWLRTWLWHWNQLGRPSRWPEKRFVVVWVLH